MKKINKKEREILEQIAYFHTIAEDSEGRPVAGEWKVDAEMLSRFLATPRRKPLARLSEKR